LTKPETFTHLALFYDDLNAFLEDTVPFIREGIEAGDAALVAVDRAKGEALRARLPEANGDVHYADMAELGRNPGRIISAWAHFVREQTARGLQVRGIGEPIWHGRTRDEIVECQRHEELLNVAFADQPGFVLLCPYDRANLEDSVLFAACSSHPLVTCDGQTIPSTAYSADVTPFAGRLPEPGGPVERLDFGDEHLTEVRRRVLDRATAAGLDPERAADLVLAVTEAATNTLRHAGGDGVVRIWREPGSIVCEVLDRGRIEDPLAGRLPVAADQPSGRGLWLVNQLCDFVQIRSSETGNTVRMHVRC
jgi:anti-sigma regulatory factor (Ser/Thr protein kinase)